MLKIDVLDRLLCVLQAYTPNATSEYQALVDEVNDVLLRESPTESPVLKGEFSQYPFFFRFRPFFYVFASS